MIDKFPYVRNVNFPHRYISPEKLFIYLRENFSDGIQEIGRSVLGKPIYCFSIGKGNINVAAWSQMHGNESTATLAMLDFLSTISEAPYLSNELFEKIHLDFIFMLNPDGAEKWTRRNALEIDLNRDFLKSSSPEINVLKNFILKKKYDYALNLHDQRTIFTTDGSTPATLSFLSPSEDEERTLTENRKKSMAVIGKIYEYLEQEIPNQIGRYTDEFYPTSVGDNFMKAGIPTLLFEGGHFPDDYIRVGTRKYYTYAFYLALKAMTELKGKIDFYKTYNEIPENKATHCDLIYRNVQLPISFDCEVDIAVQYQECYEGDSEISFVPYIIEIGDCSKRKAWKEIDCKDKKIIFSDNCFPKINEKVNFEVK